MMENFVKSEQAPFREEGVVFLAKFLAHLESLLQEPKGGVSRLELVILQFNKVVFYGEGIM